MEKIEKTPGFYIFPTRLECGFTFSPPVSSVVLYLFPGDNFQEKQKLQSKQINKGLRDLIHPFRIPTRFECIFTSFPLVSSVVSQLSHSFRVYFHIFPTRFECDFKVQTSMSATNAAFTTGEARFSKGETTLV